VTRAAVCLRGDGGTAREYRTTDDPFGEDLGGGRAPVGAVGRYLVEPDDAVIRAGLVGAIVAETGGRLLDPRLAYVTFDERPGLAGQTVGPGVFRVLDVGNADVSRLRAVLHELGAGDVVVKTRGIRADPIALRRSMRLRGGGPTLVVLLARVDAGALAVVGTPVAT
jgi:hypothetical protein